MYQVHIRQYVAAKRGKAGGNQRRSSRRIVTTARDRYFKALKAWKKALEAEQPQKEKINDRRNLQL